MKIEEIKLKMKIGIKWINWIEDNIEDVALKYLLKKKEFEAIVCCLSIS